MDRDTTEREPALSRRAFLATAGGVLAGTAALGLVGQAAAGQWHPQRGSVLRFATGADAAGLDPHRHLLYPVSVPLAATMQGLLDLNLYAEPVLGIAAEWDASPDLQTYTCKLRRRVLFHNGQEVDAAAVKWNFARMQHPKTSHPSSARRCTSASVRWWRGKIAVESALEVGFTFTIRVPAACVDPRVQPGHTEIEEECDGEDPARGR